MKLPALREVIIVRKNYDNAQELANTAAALARAGDVEHAQAVFTQALHAANTVNDIFSNDRESSTKTTRPSAGDSEQDLHAADGTSKSADQARLTPGEVMMTNHQPESKAVMVILVAMILAGVWLGFLVSRHS